VRPEGLEAGHAMNETTTVTVLFTDVVGSTSLRQHQGETAAHKIMNEHNEIVRKQIAHHTGQEVKTAGDSFMVAFESARKAVECAVSVQRALHDYNVQHPSHPVRVRIGLHTGEAIRAGSDLFGTSVDAAARIMAKAGGDQILVSDVLKSILGSAKDLSFKDHKRSFARSPEAVAWLSSPEKRDWERRGSSTRLRPRPRHPACSSSEDIVVTWRVHCPTSPSWRPSSTD